MSARFPSRGTRNTSGDGYSTSKSKNGGGVFRSEATIVFEYKQLDKSLDAGTEEFAKLYRGFKKKQGVGVSVTGRAGETIDVFAGWRKVIKHRVREIAVATSEVMEKEMLLGIGGRIETGTMKGSVRRKTMPTSAKREVSRAGWLNNWYKYFGFQEEGTSTGIKPMRSTLRAVVRGRIFASKQLAKMARDLRSAGKGSVKRS